jgi:hypothetical protein
MAQHWMSKLHLHHGALHRALGVPEGKPIPASKEEAAAKRPGRVGREARLALVFRRVHKGKA